MIKKVGKKQITEEIYNRLDGAISTKELYYVVSLITKEITDIILRQESISIKNFGTLSSYLFHGHKGFNVATRTVEYVEPFKTVKLYVHVGFKSLLQKNREKFNKSSR